MQTFPSARKHRICHKGYLKQGVRCLTSMHIFCWTSHGRPEYASTDIGAAKSQGDKGEGGVSGISHQL